MIENIQRVVCSGGKAYIGVPVGSEDKLMFNAHRIFSIKTVLSLFSQMTLLDMAIVKGNNTYTEKITESEYDNIDEYCYSAKFDEIEARGFSLVPSKYIKFVNRDENIDYDTKMKKLQAELTDLLKQEEESKKDLLQVFKELGYEIKL